MAKHYLIFIHGIGEREPEQSTASQKRAEQAVNQSYETLWNNIARNYQLTTDQQFETEFIPIYTDWHTEGINRAEAAIYNAAFPGLSQNPLSLFRPLRNFTTFFVGDVVAYVSEDVNVIRRTVWQKVWAELRHPLREENATYSIIAHSLGTVIAFDYLFELMARNKLFVTELNPEMAISPSDIQLLQERFRHFFTLGSPIGLFMLRKGSLWDHCQPFSEIYNPVCDRRTWLNFYDRKDIIAYPLRQLFCLNPTNQDHLPEDVPLRVGLTPFGAHTHYWKNKKIAQRIATTLSQTAMSVDAIAPSREASLSRS